MSDEIMPFKGPVREQCIKLLNSKFPITALQVAFWDGWQKGKDHASQASNDLLTTEEKLAQVERERDEAIKQAFMAGQADAGVDPSWSSACAYLTNQKTDE